MTVLMTLLVGTLMSAFFVGFFGLGYYLGTKKSASNEWEMNKDNQEAIKGIADWLNYRG